MNEDQIQFDVLDYYKTCERQNEKLIKLVIKFARERGLSDKQANDIAYNVLWCFTTHILNAKKQE